MLTHTHYTDDQNKGHNAVNPGSIAVLSVLYSVCVCVCTGLVILGDVNETVKSFFFFFFFPL